MSFHPKIKNKLIAILFAIIPAFVVGSLVLGANVYYDLDSAKIMINENNEIAGSLTVSGTGNILFSTSGTINQTGAGQVTFAGNVDASSGLDVTGALTSTGNTTLSTGASTTNTFGSGASSINTIGSATTPGALTLHGAATLDNTFGLTYSGASTVLSITQSGAGAITNLTNTVSATSAAFTLTNLGSGSSLVINDSASDTTPFVIDASGNVGIGTSSLSGVKFKIGLDSSSVSDGYDNQSKIASLTNAAVSAGKLQISEAACGAYTVLDVGGNSYNTVLIGTQCWLKQNLRTGTQLATGNTTPSNNGTIEKWCPAPSGTAGTVDNIQYAANCVTDGGLYQWNEAMGYVTTEGAQGICPTGWHIPTDAQQYILENYLKDGANTCDSTRTGWDCDTAGTKLKVGGTSGFEGILAGYRNTDGSFYSRLTHAYLWSSSQYDASNAWRRYLYSGSSTVYRDYYDNAYGFSVRCLKD